MKLRYLKTERKVKVIESCDSLPKFLHWLRVIPPFRDREVTLVRMSHKLQYRENDNKYFDNKYFSWIDVPTVEVKEDE